MDFTNISFYSLSALINFFTSSFFGTFVYLQNRKSPVGRSFALFMWFIAAWSITFFLFFQATDYNIALILGHVTVAPAVFISIACFHFVVNFLNIWKKFGVFVRWGYIVMSFFFVVCLFPFTWFIETVRPISVFPYMPSAGFLFHPYIILWFAYFVFSFVLLFLYYGRADSIKKAQIRYILAGLIFGNAGGSMNWLLFYDIPIVPPIILLSFLVLAYGYAMLKHHLFNIRMFAVEILTFAIWFVLIVKIFATSQADGPVFFDIIIFLAIVLIGSFLIRVGGREARQKEQLARLNADLDDLNHNLQKKVDEQTKEVRDSYEVEKQAREKLEALDVAKTEFVLASQHNLRTPLTIVKGYIEGIATSLKGGKKVDLKEYVDKTSGALEILAKIVNGLIDVTDLKVGKEGFSKENNKSKLT